MISTMKNVKMTYKGTIKRSAFPETFEDLTKILSKSYDLCIREVINMNISYMDDEGDTVLISNEFDYIQAKKYMETEGTSILKITLEKRENDDDRKNSLNFEMINLGTKFELIEKFDEDRGEIKVKTGSDSIVSINELKITSELAKSQFLNDTNTDMCQDLINNIEEKNEGINNENKISHNKEKKFTEKISENFNKLAEQCKQKLNEKIKDVNSFRKIIDEEYFPLLKNILNNGNPNHETNSYSAKKELRKKMKKIIKNEMNKIGESLLKEINTLTDIEIDKIFIQKNNNKSKYKCTATHTNVRCDGCSIKPILGSRYKCSICENFDYCQDCEEKFKDSHPHSFIKIRTPEIAPSQIINVISDNYAESEIDRVSYKKDQENRYLNKVINLEDKLDSKMEKLINNFNFENLKISDFLEINNDTNKQSSQFSSKCQTKNLRIEITNNTNELRKSIKILNNGSQSWPKPCYFTCLESESNVYGATNFLNIRMEPGKEVNFEICLNLKDVKKDGEYVSVWRLQDEKRNGFGEKIKITLNIKFLNDILINKEFLEIPKGCLHLHQNPQNTITVADFKKNLSSEMNFYDIVNSMKKKYSDLNGFEDKKLLYAVVTSNGDIEVAYDKLCSRNNSCGYHPKHK